MNEAKVVEATVSDSHPSFSLHLNSLSSLPPFSLPPSSLAQTCISPRSTWIDYRRVYNMSSDESDYFDYEDDGFDEPMDGKLATGLYSRSTWDPPIPIPCCGTDDTGGLHAGCGRISPVSSLPHFPHRLHIRWCYR